MSSESSLYRWAQIGEKRCYEQAKLCSDALDEKMQAGNLAAAEIEAEEILDWVKAARIAKTERFG